MPTAQQKCAWQQHMNCASIHPLTLFQFAALIVFFHLAVVQLGFCSFLQLSVQPPIYPLILSLIYSSIHPSICCLVLRRLFLHLALSVSPASTSFLQRLYVLEICHMLPSSNHMLFLLQRHDFILQCNVVYRRRANSYLCLGLGIQDLAMCYHAQRCQPILPQTYASSYPQQYLLPILVEYDCTPRR